SGKRSSVKKAVHCLLSCPLNGHENGAGGSGEDRWAARVQGVAPNIDAIHVGKCLGNFVTKENLGSISHHKQTNRVGEAVVQSRRQGETNADGITRCRKLFTLVPQPGRTAAAIDARAQCAGCDCPTVRWTAEDRNEVVLCL